MDFFYNHVAFIVHGLRASLMPVYLGVETKFIQPVRKTSSRSMFKHMSKYTHPKNRGAILQIWTPERGWTNQNHTLATYPEDRSRAHLERGGRGEVTAASCRTAASGSRGTEEA